MEWVAFYFMLPSVIQKRFHGQLTLLVSVAPKKGLLILVHRKSLLYQSIVQSCLKTTTVGISFDFFKFYLKYYPIFLKGQGNSTTLLCNLINPSFLNLQECEVFAS